MSQFVKAQRKRAYMRLALAGPTGSGKTWSALSVASQFSDRIAVIDTERGSASLYSDKFSFDAMDFRPPYDPRRLVQSMKDAAEHVGTEGVVIVDSLSHFWEAEGGLLDIVDDAAKKSPSKNGFVAWKQGTPIHNALVEAMIGLPAHLIVCMRSKMEYVQDKDSTGRTQVTKIGLAPVQRNGIEYEFTVTADLDFEHNLMVTKTRCALLDGKVFRSNKEADMAIVLRDWLAGGEGPLPVATSPVIPPPVASEAVKIARQAVKDAGWPEMNGKDLERLIKGTLEILEVPTAEEILYFAEHVPQYNAPPPIPEPSDPKTWPEVGAELELAVA